MWSYQKMLQYPIRITRPNPKLAKYVIDQYGGPQGELGASLRYLTQRFAMPCPQARGVLNDIGTEELGHLEMVGTIVRQLLQGATVEQIEEAGAAGYFLEHDRGLYTCTGTGSPYNTVGFSATGDPIADLTEDLAAEQKARAVYDNILRLADDPDVIDPIRFLRQREIVHFQRFGEALNNVQAKLAQPVFYTGNPGPKQRSI